MGVHERLAECVGFDWDAGNLDKNWKRHQVSFWEAEEVFLNEPIVLGVDPVNSREEERFFALGKTDERRKLFLAFTIRKSHVRIISARDMSAKERKAYTNHEEKDPEV